MKAETVFNVFEALPELEKQRLLKMISIPNSLTKENIKKPIITDSEAREVIYTKYLNFSNRWEQKNRLR